VYLIIYENTFCILYDRCLYACWIDLFYRFSFLFSILDCSHCLHVGTDAVQNSCQSWDALSVLIPKLLLKKSAKNVTVTLLNKTFCTPKGQSVHNLQHK